jgi:hypothetical protein
MGYTRFNQVVGVDGVYVGDKGKGDEVKVSQSFHSVHLAWASTATTSWYTSAPVAGNVVAAYLTYPVASGTGNGAVINHGTAGATFATFAAAECTVGTIVTGTLSGTVAVTAGELLKVTMTAQATSDDQVYQNITLVYDRVGT